MKTRAYYEGCEELILFVSALNRFFFHRVDTLHLRKTNSKFRRHKMGPVNTREFKSSPNSFLFFSRLRGKWCLRYPDRQDRGFKSCYLGYFRCKLLRKTTPNISTGEPVSRKSKQ